MIKHMVAFRLIHPVGSKAEQAFLDKACALAAIEGVKNFECFREVSPKNNFSFGLSMVFANEADYAFYNNHPDHVDFVENTWLKEVEDFMEIDFSAYEA